MDATGRPSQQLINAQKELARRRRAAGIAHPVSGGQWAEVSSQWVEGCAPSPLPAQPGAALVGPTATPPGERAVRLAPTLAGHCLDKKNRRAGAALDGPYRLYKILGALDAQGRGWLANSKVEPLLTRKDSTLYVYGRRQYKIILRRGEGLFWNRVKVNGGVRIRLVARAKLAAALGAGRLHGREVEMPLRYLLGAGRGRQADVNAALYAAVHTGRLRPDRSRSGQAKPRPVSRSTLRDLSGCSRYRQRSYEKRMQIRVRANVHIMGAHSEYELQRARQYHGLPAYKHIDHQGAINRRQRGAAYIALRLPNSYQVPESFAAVGSRRQRTINRLLDGLCHMGSGGSGEEGIVRLYHRDGAMAARAYQRDQETPAYWPMTHRANSGLWQVFGQRGKLAGSQRSGARG